MARGYERIAWILRRPHLVGELSRKLWRRVAHRAATCLTPNREDTEVKDWYLERSVPVQDALRLLLGDASLTPFSDRFPTELAAARERVAKCPERMGGAGSLDMIYYLSESIGATRMVETGVAYGWSSLAFLLSARRREGARLVSTNMPYLFGSEENVGCVVPPELRTDWVLLHGPDSTELPRALDMMPSIDICHYDSDKSYAGRMWSHPRIWEALRPGGVFIADDVGDNWAFRHFCDTVGRDPVIVRCGTEPGKIKTAGIITK